LLRFCSRVFMLYLTLAVTGALTAAHAYSALLAIL
jgi:hypothetical protein